MLECICINCNKLFIKKKSTVGKFCCLGCYHKNMVGKRFSRPSLIGRVPWNKGKKLPHLSGVNHPRYIKDRSLLLKQDRRNDSCYKEWRKNIYKKFNFKCALKNDDCSGRLESHHILSWAEYPELRYEINNGITLCHAHHPRARAEEKRLIPIFQELVSVSK